MCSGSPEPVTDDESVLHLVKDERPDNGDRVRKAPIARVRCTQNVNVSRRPPVDRRRRISLHRPEIHRVNEPVLLLPVDYWRVVKCRRTEPITPFIRGRVYVSPRIDDQLRSVEYSFEREAVVMSVAPSALHADRASVDKDVVPFRAEHVHAGLRKCRRSRIGASAGHSETARCFRTKQPQDLTKRAG